MRPAFFAALPLAAALLASAAMAADGYTIGISNTVQGNGWREEMICAMKAQALASGKVAASTSPTATPTPPASSRTSAT